MELIDVYNEEKECLYKDEHYKVRDNGSVLRLPKGKKMPEGQRKKMYDV